MNTEDNKNESLENILGGLPDLPDTRGDQLALWGQSAGTLEDTEEVLTKLTLKAQKNICILARNLYMQDETITGRAIYDLWPIRKTNNDLLLTMKAGPRPAVHIIERFLLSEKYIELMNELEVPVTSEDQGLSPRQVAVLTTLASYTDGKTLQQKLKSHRVSDFTFQAWLKQRPFAEAYKKLASNALQSIVATGEVQLANSVARGDMKAIEMAFAMTGRYDPANKKQVDAEKLVAIILDVIDSEVKDNDMRARIGSRIALLGGKALEM